VREGFCSVLFHYTDPNQELVTRILYRLRLTSEQRPFDSVSLNYMIPLLCIVLQQHGVGRAVEDEADEQVTLALETLSFHADTCTYNLIEVKNSQLTVI
jgi:hypothetical protein